MKKTVKTVATMTDFEKGALWALQLLKEQCGERYDRLEKARRDSLRLDGGASLVLNGMQNFLGEVRSDFETALIRTISGAQVFAEDRAVLWAHLVSEHAACIDPEAELANLVDMHDHEHRGPGTIRGHDPKSRDYSLRKIGAVLSESEE